jgi:hypothetical protein
VKERGGRSYAGFFSHGTPAGWGNKTMVGYVPLYASFTANRVPNVGFYYIGFLEANDEMYTFDDQQESSYVDFNVRSVVSYMSWEAPDFLKPRKFCGQFVVYDAPGRGYVENSILESNSQEEYRARVKRQQQGEDLIRVSYHPHWHGTVDGKPVAVHRTPTGFMSVPVPAGEHEVEVRYQ